MALNPMVIMGIMQALGMGAQAAGQAGASKGDLKFQVRKYDEAAQLRDPARARAAALVGRAPQFQAPQSMFGQPPQGPPAAPSMQGPPDGGSWEEQLRRLLMGQR